LQLIEGRRQVRHAPAPAVELPDENHVDFSPSGGFRISARLGRLSLAPEACSSTCWVMVQAWVAAYSSMRWIWSGRVCWSAVLTLA
jgi:hypothetical protein